MYIVQSNLVRLYELMEVADIEKDTGLIWNPSIFCNKLVFVPGKPFQPSLMFVGEARSLS